MEKGRQTVEDVDPAWRVTVSSSSNNKKIVMSIVNVKKNVAVWLYYKKKEIYKCKADKIITLDLNKKNYIFSIILPWFWPDNELVDPEDSRLDPDPASKPDPEPVSKDGISMDGAIDEDISDNDSISLPLIIELLVTASKQAPFCPPFCKDDIT